MKIRVITGLNCVASGKRLQLMTALCFWLRVTSKYEVYLLLSCVCSKNLTGFVCSAVKEILSDSEILSYKLFFIFFLLPFLITTSFLFGIGLEWAAGFNFFVQKVVKCIRFAFIMKDASQFISAGLYNFIQGSINRQIQIRYLRYHSVRSFKLSVDPWLHSYC